MLRTKLFANSNVLHYPQNRYDKHTSTHLLFTNTINSEFQREIISCSSTTLSDACKTHIEEVGGSVVSVRAVNWDVHGEGGWLERGQTRGDVRGQGERVLVVGCEDLHHHRCYYNQDHITTCTHILTPGVNVLLLTRCCIMYATCWQFETNKHLYIMRTYSNNPDGLAQSFHLLVGRFLLILDLFQFLIKLRQDCRMLYSVLEAT